MLVYERLYFATTGELYCSATSSDLMCRCVAVYLLRRDVRAHLKWEVAEFACEDSQGS
jgi:hypothetical protein